MEASKLKTPAFKAELSFGAGPDDVLKMLLDPDIVNEKFLIDADHSARQIFGATVASIRLALKHQTMMPGTAQPAAGEPAAVKGQRRQRKPSKKQLAKQRQEIIDKAAKPMDIEALSELIPNEDESWLLAQASECTFMAEALARVILEWNLTINKVPAPITQPREYDCCKEAGNDCRHASEFLRARPREVLRKLFKFVMFEAQAPEKKASTPSEPT